MPHNGRTTQLNTWFITQRSNYPFANAALTATIWSIPGFWFDPTKHDANGYMHTLYGTGVTLLNIFIPSQAQRPGKWVLLWDGTGAVGITSSFTNGSGDTSGNGGRYEFLPSTNSLSYKVTSVGTPGTDYPHNIRVCHIDDETALAADPYAFTGAFLAIASTAGVLRFLDWGNTNLSQLVNFADRLPITHYSYGAPYWKSGNYFVTTNVSDAYSATTGRGALTDGEHVILKFNATSSGLTPTFNRDGTGDIQISFPDGRDLFSANQKPLQDQVGILTYSSVLGRWLKYGGDSEANAQGMNSGVPVEIMLKLCKEAGAHPWFCIPHLALDTFKTYTTDLATYVKAWTDANAPWMIPRYEPTNELWNFANGFFQTRFAWACEVAKGYANFGDDEWYGRALSKVGQAISAVYGGDETKYEVIGAVQVTDTPATITAARFGSARYVTESGNAANAAQDWCTTVTPAYYWSAGMINDATESALADAYVAASAAAKPALVASYIRTEGSQSGTPEKTKVRMTTWQNFATSKSLKHMPYEGGVDIGKVPTPSTNTETLRNAAYDSPELYYVTQQLHQHLESIGGLFMSKYNLAGRAGLSAFDPDIYATPSQEWLAILAFDSASTNGGWAPTKTRSKDIKANEERKHRLKKQEQQLEKTIKLAYQRLTGKVTEPPQLKQDLSPPKLAVLAEKMAEQLIEKSKNSAKQRTRNKEIIKDLQRQAAAIMQEEEEAIVMLLH